MTETSKRASVPAVRDRVLSLGPDALQWGFHANHPQLRTTPRHPDACASFLDVDPFPCYAHDASLVAQVAAQVEAAFPCPWPPNYYLLSFEEVSRTNGHAQPCYIYEGDGPRYPFEPHVVLSGKRIPLHPAMTRYLVAHEYGHCVNYWIEFKRRDKDEVVTRFDREYAAMRGVEASGSYGAGHWHANTGELIANDFRICVCGIEPEFWPHPGFTHPLEMPDVQKFWRACVEEHAQSPDPGAETSQ